MGKHKLIREGFGKKGSGAYLLLYEEELGGKLKIAFTDPVKGYTAKLSVGYTIRDAEHEVIPDEKKKLWSRCNGWVDDLLHGQRPMDESEDDERAEMSSVGLVFDLFREEEIPDKTDDRAGRLRSGLDAWERWLGREFDLSDLSAREWNSFRRQRIKGEIDSHGRRVRDPEKRREVSPGLAGKALGTLRQVCRWASRYRPEGRGRYLLPEDPTKEFDKPANPNPTRIKCGDRRYDQLLATSGYVHWYLPVMLVLARHTGARRSAIARLRWSDWLPDRGSHGSLHWRAESDKIGKERIVVVRPEVRLALEAHRDRFPGIGDAWVFPAPRGTGATRGDVMTNWLGRAERLAGLDHPKGFGWHSFRRMWVTKRKHLPNADVAHVGGWKDQQTLQRCYQASDQETQRRVVLEESDVVLQTGEMSR